MDLIRKTKTKITKNGNKIRYAIFKCSFCLQEVERQMSNGLKQKSCGCQQHSQETRQKISKTRIEKGVAKGEKNPFYGSKLFIGENNPFYGKKHTEETRQKIKDKHVDFSGENHPMFGKQQTEETRRKIREAKKGKYSKELSSNWQNGKSLEEYGIEFNRGLKHSILERDNYKCQNPNCGYKTNTLDVHHIDYNKENNNPGNLTTLCHSCHAKTSGKNNRQYWTEFYQNIMEKLYAD